MGEWWSATREAFAALTGAHVAGVTVVSLLVFALDGWTIWRAASRGHGVQGTLAWIFAIVALPVVGALAFMVLASPSVRRVTLKRKNARIIRYRCYGTNCRKFGRIA